MIPVGDSYTVEVTVFPNDGAVQLDFFSSDCTKNGQNSCGGTMGGSIQNVNLVATEE